MLAFSWLSKVAQAVFARPAPPETPESRDPLSYPLQPMRIALAFASARVNGQGAPQPYAPIAKADLLKALPDLSQARQSQRRDQGVVHTVYGFPNGTRLEMDFNAAAADPGQNLKGLLTIRLVQDRGAVLRPYGICIDGALVGDNPPMFFPRAVSATKPDAPDKIWIASPSPDLIPYLLDTMVRTVHAVPPRAPQGPPAP